jgi:hypothetical protein
MARRRGAINSFGDPAFSNRVGKLRRNETKRQGTRTNEKKRDEAAKIQPLSAADFFLNPDLSNDPLPSLPAVSLSFILFYRLEPIFLCPFQ